MPSNGIVSNANGNAPMTSTASLGSQCVGLQFAPVLWTLWTNLHLCSKFVFSVFCIVYIGTEWIYITNKHITKTKQEMRSEEDRTMNTVYKNFIMNLLWRCSWQVILITQRFYHWLCTSSIISATFYFIRWNACTKMKIILTEIDFLTWYSSNLSISSSFVYWFQCTSCILYKSRWF